MVRRSQAKVDECFRTCYRADNTDAQLRLERLVFGSDYGADGWTTIEQADELAAALSSGPPRTGGMIPAHPRDDQRQA
jgi:hypothetical protein